MPRYGWGGLMLVAVFWPLNWILPGLRTHILFFPLWFGYILFMGGQTHRRKGSSLISRSPVRFSLLFVVSAPAWWFFESVNLRTGNWEYLARDQFSDLEYALLATICFSTVMPAVFATYEWVSTLKWTQRFANGRRVVVSKKAAIVCFVAGLIMAVLLVAWPRYAYPLTWSLVFFIAEPINYRFARKSVFAQMGGGDWQSFVTLPLAALICGIFWEMWNIFAYPKWIYHIPFVDFGHIFEMPVLGYIGYLPFGLDLYALYHLIAPRRWQLAFV